MPDPGDSGPTAERTRAALVEAGLRLFGEKGFAATSTRELAATASANIGSIAYHFGGKEGLRQACAAHIVGMMKVLAAPVLTAPVPDEPALARRQLVAAVERMVPFMVGGAEAATFVPFVLRELQHPTAALDTIYDGIFAPVHRRFCALFGAAVGADPESEAVRLAVFTLIGQVVYFRIGREAVVRRMGWQGIGASEVAAIVVATRANLDAIIDGWGNR